MQKLPEICITLIGGDFISGYDAVYIPSLDGKDIFISNNYKDGTPNGYNLKKKNGDYNLSKFINTLSYSLDLIKLKEVHEQTYNAKNFFWKDGYKKYSFRVINVTFKYSNKEFNRVRPDTYVKFGYRVEDEEFDDCICVREGQLIGIQVNKPVSHPLPSSVLGKYFYVDDGKYRAKKNIKTLHSVADIRRELYTNGFICNGIEYVRFKRSSGASRVGKCLFIDKRLYRKMHKWEMCGIEVRKGQKIDLASLEPYIALTLSSIIDTIEIKAKNILVVDDYESVFKDNVVATRLVDGELVTKPEYAEIRNSIWDGQSLMDKSLFGKYENKGMLLLRARFFKSCCFNTNIQDWFRDNGITDVSQLNGMTRAKKIEDVKLITTPSSIKFLKFGSLDEWLNNLDSVFGVVKYEKPTHFFGGKLVQTHYQLINTLELYPEEVDELIRPSLEYMDNIQRDPAFLRHRIGYQYAEADEGYGQVIQTKNDIIYKMLGINDEFAKTKLYRNFESDLIKSMIKDLRCGHILVRGNYSTLCGNPIEMLKQSIGMFDGTSVIKTETVHSTNFDDGEKLLGSRSPHVACGNVLLTTNVLHDEITRYLNPTKEIVYVNSINENLLERLSGSDYDSDSLLLTNNPVLIEAAERNYDKFLVPTKFVDSIKLNRRYTSEDKADLDIKTSVNKIGEIINLSQEIQSIMWDKIHNGSSIDDVMEIYCDTAQLDVMSNLEIDSAKREIPCDNVYELKKLKEKYDIRDEKGRHIRPLFFKYIDGYKGYNDEYYIYIDNEKHLVTGRYSEAKSVRDKHPDRVHIEKGRMTYMSMKTSMDFLQDSIGKFKRRRRKASEYCKFSDLLVPVSELQGQVYYPQIHRIVAMIEKAKSDIGALYAGVEVDRSFAMMRSQEIKEELVQRINSISINSRGIRHILTLLDDKKYSGISKYLFDVVFDLHCDKFYELLEESRTSVPRLFESADGDIDILGIKYFKKC